MTERWRTFLLLGLGALLFLATLLAGGRVDSDFPFLLEAFTILFGLPLVLRELGRRTNWLLIAYFVLWVPLCHRLAWEAGARVFRLWQGEGLPLFADLSRASLLAALAGGFVGACSSFAAFALPRLRAPDARPIPTIAAGIGLLALLAGLVIRFGGEYAFVILHPLWQLLFALFLARLLRPSPPRQPLQRPGPDAIGGR